MAKKITAKSGPLNGKTFIVPDTQTTFTHHAAPGGHYKVNAKTATWKADVNDDASTKGDETEPPTDG